MVLRARVPVVGVYVCALATFIPGRRREDWTDASQPFSETTITSPDGKGRATFIGLGATLVEMWVPDANGTMRDVVLGYDDRVSFPYSFLSQA